MPPETFASQMRRENAAEILSDPNLLLRAANESSDSVPQTRLKYQKILAQFDVKPTTVTWKDANIAGKRIDAQDRLRKREGISKPGDKDRSGIVVDKESYERKLDVELAEIDRIITLQNQKKYEGHSKERVLVRENTERETKEYLRILKDEERAWQRRQQGRTEHMKRHNAILEDKKVQMQRMVEIADAMYANLEKGDEVADGIWRMDGTIPDIKLEGEEEEDRFMGDELNDVKMEDVDDEAGGVKLNLANLPNTDMDVNMETEVFAFRDPSQEDWRLDSDGRYRPARLLSSQSHPSESRIGGQPVEASLSMGNRVDPGLDSLTSNSLASRRGTSVGVLSPGRRKRPASNLRKKV